MKLYVTGGRTKGDASWRADDYQFERAVVLAVDVPDGACTTVVDYRSPPEVCEPDKPLIVFKAGTIVGNHLYACTTTEILIYEVPGFRLVRHVTLPCFNDVHHVRPSPDGTLLVASTGLDLVLELSPDGDVLNEWSSLETPVWERFSREVDYRRVSTKPHQSHPNYVFFLGDEVWATRFRQRDAISLTRPGRRIEIGVEKPHDGIVTEDRIYFTTVDGRVVIASSETLDVIAMHDIRSLIGTSQALGWCRGLCLLAPDVVVVGFTRIRRTAAVENLSWALHQAGPLARLAQSISIGGRSFRNLSLMPTRLVALDLAQGRVLWEYDLEAHGLNAVFSVLPAPPEDQPAEALAAAGAQPAVSASA